MMKRKRSPLVAAGKRRRVETRESHQNVNVWTGKEKNLSLLRWLELEGGSPAFSPLYPIFLYIPRRKLIDG
jgi:hypothetical protein